MEESQGNSSDLLSDEDFSAIVEDLVHFFKLNGIGDISLNGGVSGVVTGHVTFANCKAMIALAKNPPPITFTISMSNDYITECFGSQTSEKRKQMKHANQKILNVRRDNLDSLVNFVKEYCRDLCAMRARHVKLPPLNRNPPSEKPMPSSSVDAAEKEKVSPQPINNSGNALNRNPPSEKPVPSSSVDASEKEKVSPPPINNSGDDSLPQSNPRASSFQNLIEILKKIEKVIDSIPDGSIDPVPLYALRRWFEIVKKQLTGS
jgi:hypothetical protein